MKVRNTFIIFIVSGFWHGANWTYIVWGLFHALLFLPLMLFNLNRSNLVANSYVWIDFFKIGITFLLVCIGWVFFRADSISEAIQYLNHLAAFENLGISFFYKTNANLILFAISVLSISILSVQELVWVIKKREVPFISSYSAVVLVLLLFLMGSFKNQVDFIYFQF